MTEITGVILTAGKASRLYPLNEHTPKALLSVGNRPLILHAIEQMKELGVTEFYVVVGHLSEQIVDYLKDGRDLGIKITYVEQKQAIGIANALAQVVDYIHTPFLVFLGDIFMVCEDLKMLIRVYEERQAKAVLAVKEEPDTGLIRKNFSVVAEQDGRVTKVVEKPKGTLTTRFKGCGVYFFDPVIFEAIRMTPRTALRDEYEITNSIQLLIDSGEKVYHAPIIKWDMNVTVPTDLLVCNLHYLKMLKKDILIGENTRINSGCIVKNSVIGNNVTIKKRIKIEDSLILSDIVVDESCDVEQSLITSAGKVSCMLEESPSGVVFK